MQSRRLIRGTRRCRLRRESAEGYGFREGLAYSSTKRSNWADFVKEELDETSFPSVAESGEKSQDAEAFGSLAPMIRKYQEKIFGADLLPLLAQQDAFARALSALDAQKKAERERRKQEESQKATPKRSQAEESSDAASASEQKAAALVARRNKTLKLSEEHPIPTLRELLEDDDLVRLFESLTVEKVCARAEAPPGAKPEPEDAPLPPKRAPDTDAAPSGEEAAKKEEGEAPGDADADADADAASEAPDEDPAIAKDPNDYALWLDPSYVTGEAPATTKEILWKTFRHNGVGFPPPYEPHGVPLLFKGRRVGLAPASEEVATFWARSMHLACAANPVYRENFLFEFKQVLGRDGAAFAEELLDVAELDFSLIRAHLDAEKDFLRNDEERARRLRQEREEMKERFGFVMIDGMRVPVTPYMVEIPDIFKGRGRHPKTGLIKERVQPEDVTLNLDPHAPIPPPPRGHRWEGVMYAPNALWVARWTDTISGQNKYARPSDMSFFKSVSDIRKFEKARTLCHCIGAVRARYKQLWDSKSVKDVEIGLVIYILDTLAIRAGGDKDTDETADTVGVCSLRVEHVRPIAGTRRFLLDFLGKDSVPYRRVVEFEPRAAEVMKRVWYFNGGRHLCGDADEATCAEARRSKLFAHTTLLQVTKYLHRILEGLSAKVFRTYNSSVLFERILHTAPRERYRDFDANLHSRRLFFQAANREVAILCNHQSNVSTAFSDKVRRLDARIRDAAVQEMLDRRTHLEYAEAFYRRFGAEQFVCLAPAGGEETSDEEQSERKPPLAPKVEADAAPDGFSLAVMERLPELLEASAPAARRKREKMQERTLEAKRESQKRAAEREDSRAVVRQVRELQAAGEKGRGYELAKRAKTLIKQSQRSQRESSDAPETQEESTQGSQRPRSGAKRPFNPETASRAVLYSRLLSALRATTRRRAAVKKLLSQRESIIENREISLTTSLQNYIDPRIVVAFCRRERVPVTQIYSRSMLLKFPWALRTPPTWRFFEGE